MKDKLQQEKAAIFKALGHPVRLSIVEALAKYEMCACEIAELFHFDRTTISKHIALLRDLEEVPLLRDLDIIEDRKDGLHIYYSLKMRCLTSMLQCIERVIQGHPVYEEHYLQCYCAARKEREDENTDIGNRLPKM